MFKRKGINIDYELSGVGNNKMLKLLYWRENENKNAISLTLLLRKSKLN